MEVSTWSRSLFHFGSTSRASSSTKDEDLRAVRPFLVSTTIRRTSSSVMAFPLSVAIHKPLVTGLTSKIPDFPEAILATPRLKLSFVQPAAGACIMFWTASGIFSNSTTFSNSS